MLHVVTKCSAGRVPLVLTSCVDMRHVFRLVLGKATR